MEWWDGMDGWMDSSALQRILELKSNRTIHRLIIRSSAVSPILSGNVIMRNYLIKDYLNLLPSEPPEHSSTANLGNGGGLFLTLLRRL